MSLKAAISVFICLIVVANIEALVIGSRRAIYSPRTILSSVSDADTVNIGFGRPRRISSLSSISNLGLGRRTYRPRMRSGLRSGSNLFVVGGGDIDFPSVEYGDIRRVGGLRGISIGDADSVTLSRGTNLRLAARAGILEDVDQVNII
ncbi:uncharacterized protein [Argopecten irradians]|uniref:uncharacterized protein n=1 Tax=Argopecten irradians TaxID=31199 RepID=UPI003724A8EA